MKHIGISSDRSNHVLLRCYRFLPLVRTCNHSLRLGAIIDREEKGIPIKIYQRLPSSFISPLVVDSRYAKLETLLKAQDFRAADLETDKVMLAVANRESEGWLTTEHAEKFPCKELRSIDQLWLKYSRGKFGISVQQQIYESLGGTKEWDIYVFKQMGDRVGWRREGNWLSYSDLNFSQTAPSGHLPGFISYFIMDTSLLSRHAECNT